MLLPTIERATANEIHLAGYIGEPDFSSDEAKRISFIARDNGSTDFFLHAFGTCIPFHGDPTI